MGKSSTHKLSKHVVAAIQKSLSLQILPIFFKRPPVFWWKSLDGIQISEIPYRTHEILQRHPRQCRETPDNTHSWIHGYFGHDLRMLDFPSLSEFWRVYRVTAKQYWNLQVQYPRSHLGVPCPPRLDMNSSQAMPTWSPWNLSSIKVQHNHEFSNCRNKWNTLEREWWQYTVEWVPTTFPYVSCVPTVGKRWDSVLLFLIPEKRLWKRMGSSFPNLHVITPP